MEGNLPNCDSGVLRPIIADCQNVTPIVFVVFFVLSATPQTGGNSQGI